MSTFEQTASETVWTGRIGTVRVERYRHADGEEVVREVVGHPGAVAIAAHDGTHVWLVRQPREIVGERALLEVPAGKLDEDGEDPLEAAKRELAEEVGKAAGAWERMKVIYTSPGFTDERIEIVAWPLARLDDAIAATEDAKSLVALLLLRARRG